MILQTDILKHANESRGLDSEYSVKEAQRIGLQTAFLSHSHKDARLAKGLQAFLREHGWTVYIDWEDTSMPDKPNRETAEKIKNKIKSLDWFLYLATANSAASRWCPWEIGYADAAKGVDKIVIIPTTDGNEQTHGNEYLDLYRRVAPSTAGGYGLFRSNHRGVALKDVRIDR